MPQTLTPLQIRFVQAYLANGGQQARAYLVASPKAKQGTAEANASRLMLMDKIQQELTVFRDKIAERGEVTQDKLLAEYWASYHTARALLDIGAARMCLDSIGKLTGLMESTLNVKHSGAVTHQNTDSLTVDELRSLAGLPLAIEADWHELPPGADPDAEPDASPDASLVSLSEATPEDRDSDQAPRDTSDGKL